MKSWTWLRIAAVLQALGTMGHTMATARNAATRGPQEQAVFDAMRGFRFDIAGANRSHWDFYRGYELEITVTFATVAVVFWLLSNLSRSDPERARPLVLTMLVYEILSAAVSWGWFFAGPG